MNDVKLRVIEETNEYLEVVLRIPKAKIAEEAKAFTENDALEIANRGMKEYSAGKAKEWKGLKAFLKK